MALARRRRVRTEANESANARLWGVDPVNPAGGVLQDLTPNVNAIFAQLGSTATDATRRLWPATC